MLDFQFTTTWLPNVLFALAALAVVGGVLGLNADSTGERLQAVGIGAMLAVVGVVLRLPGRRSRP